MRKVCWSGSASIENPFIDVRHAKGGERNEAIFILMEIHSSETKLQHEIQATINYFDRVRFFPLFRCFAFIFRFFFFRCALFFFIIFFPVLLILITRARRLSKPKIELWFIFMHTFAVMCFRSFPFIFIFFSSIRKCFACMLMNFK